MNVETGLLENGLWSWPSEAISNKAQAQLVLAFGAKGMLLAEGPLADLRQRYPAAAIVAASTAGEIVGARVLDDSLVATALYFKHSTVATAATQIENHADSASAGAHLMQELMGKEGLQGIFVLSDGALVNGSELVAGLSSVAGNIPISGGLAGDGDRFESTLVSHNGVTAKGMVAAVGFYGEAIQLSYGSFGGWDEFGPERIITKAEQNVLMEIDGRSALELYKTYLGPYSEELPGSALLFPLAMRETGKPEMLVRTILGINETDGSMTFAGNMPVGSTVRLMKANFENLIHAAGTAAGQALQPASSQGHASLALCISCVGRKLVLQDRADEEIIAVREVLPPQTTTVGFYSYGEISPYKKEVGCNLHNQTMTITLLHEVE
jgi:hypothetical protein